MKSIQVIYYIHTPIYISKYMCIGELVGFCDIGDINNYLAAFEKSIQDEQADQRDAGHLRAMYSLTSPASPTAKRIQNQPRVQLTIKAELLALLIFFIALTKPHHRGETFL